jgi:hypothetical protein
MGAPPGAQKKFRQHVKMPQPRIPHQAIVHINPKTTTKIGQ